MRTIRLGRTFAAILSLGWAIANLHGNDDLDRAMATFAHSEQGTLLVLEIINADRTAALPAGSRSTPRAFPPRPRPNT